MSKSKIIAVAALATVLAGHAYAAPQEEGGRLPDNPNAVCLSRSLDVSEGERQFSVVAPKSNAPALELKGFTHVQCGDAFRSRREALRFRDRVCEIASIPNDRLQDNFERRLGERPAVLCGMAELVVGQWQRSRAR
jgi:hypothetical protein